MKFTEGFWEKSEAAHACYAVQAYEVEEIENGMRVTAPFRTICNRACALDVGTLTFEFTSADEDIISVRCFHFEGYEKREPRFMLNREKCIVNVDISEDEAVMSAGNVSVHVGLKEFYISYKRSGKDMTSCGFKNVGYMRHDRKNSTKYPETNYLAEDYNPYIVSEFSLAAGECVYGLGERFTAFVKNGQTVDCWNEDGGTSSQISYKNIPFYITNKNYGIYVDHSTDVSFEVASEKVEAVGVSVKGEEMRYYVIGGSSMKKVLEHYTSLTGKPALPPAWSFGLWLSSSFTTDYDEKTVNSFIEGMKARDLPFDVFHFDCFWMRGLHWCDFKWNEKTFPDVRGMLKRYKDKGLKICVWINPYVAQGTVFFREGLKKGYFLMRADGLGVKQVDNWQPGMAVIDFTNPEAVIWYQEKLKELLDMGVDCFKSDFGERIPVDVTYANGADAWGMHNYYTLLYNQTVFELLKREKGEKEAVLFARSATVGGQRFPVHWGGDCTGTYESMAESLRGGLSFMLSGFSYWSHDIGGFELAADADVYKRWLQFGLLSTHSRLHGSKSYRVPWLFDEESVEVCREFTKLKLKLMPYIYSMAVESHKTGIPVMRPMILEFENDPAVKYLDMQYMLGDRLLVAPIFNKEGIGEYYLPKGVWTHLLNGERKEGGRWYREIYDYHSLPLFVAENSLLPMGSNEKTAGYSFAENVQIGIYELREGQKAECRIPDKEGNIVLNVRGYADKDKIYLSSCGRNERITYVLNNVPEIRSISGGTVQYDKERRSAVVAAEGEQVILGK